MGGDHSGYMVMVLIRFKSKMAVHSVLLMAVMMMLSLPEVSLSSGDPPFTSQSHLGSNQLNSPPSTTHIPFPTNKERPITSDPSPDRRKMPFMLNSDPELNSPKASNTPAIMVLAAANVAVLSKSTSSRVNIIPVGKRGSFSEVRTERVKKTRHERSDQLQHNHNNNQEHYNYTHLHHTHTNNTVKKETDKFKEYFNISTLSFNKLLDSLADKPWINRIKYKNYSNSGSLYDSVSDQDDDFVTSMNLCKPPPEMFMYDFVGYSKDECEKVDSPLVNYQYIFNSTLDLCDIIYETLGNEGITYYEMKHPLFQTYLIYVEPIYVKLCAALHQNCETDGYFIYCPFNAGTIIFVNPATCPVSGNTVATELLLNNIIPLPRFQCVKEICTGDKSVTSFHVNGLGGVILKTPLYSFNNDDLDDLCLSVNMPKPRPDTQTYVIFNTHWPFCYAMNIIFWFANPEAHGLRGGWSYLPLNCMLVEAVFIGIVGCVAVSGVAGNALVLAVINTDEKKLSESRLLRASLALSDLLMGVCVVVPSFYYHLVPILYPPDYLTYSEEMIVSAHSILVMTEGVGLLQAMLRTVCTLVSFFMLFMLSVERFVLCGRPLKYSDYCSTCTVKLTITFSWILAAFDTLLLTYREETGWFAAEWSQFDKLPKGTNYYYTNNELTSWIVTRVTSYFAFLVVLGTVLFSLLAIVRFLIQQRNARGEFKYYDLHVSKSVREEELYIIHGLSLMTFFFILSTLPSTIIIIYTNTNILTRNFTVVPGYIAEWCLLLAIAWNPWLYNFRESQFREDTWTLLRSMRNRFKLPTTHID